jgi:hypothetical protein
MKVAGFFISGIFITNIDRCDLGRSAMAKGQKRSNREVKKPKQTKQAPPAPVGMTRGISASNTAPKKKN